MKQLIIAITFLISFSVVAQDAAKAKELLNEVHSKAKSYKNISIQLKPFRKKVKLVYCFWDFNYFFYIIMTKLYFVIRKWSYRNKDKRKDVSNF